MKRHLGIWHGKAGAGLGSVVLAAVLAAVPARAHEAGRLDESATCGTAVAGCSGNPTNAGAAASQLPPEIELDRFLMQADQAVEDRDPQAARSAMERIVGLQEEHRIQPAPEDHFRYARAWELAGEQQRAQAAVTTYLQLLGRDAPNYREALLLLNEAEAGASRPAAGSDPLGAAPEGPAGMEFVWIPAGEVPDGFHRFGGGSRRAAGDAGSDQPGVLAWEV